MRNLPKILNFVKIIHWCPYLRIGARGFRRRRRGGERVRQAAEQGLAGLRVPPRRPQARAQEDVGRAAVGGPGS